MSVRDWRERSMRRISLVAAAGGLAATLLATMPGLTEEKSLYQRIGGYDAIAAVTEDFLARLEKDESLGRFFQGVSDDSVARIRQHVIDLVCAQTGGPCKYTGRDMKTSHAGLGITRADWERSNMR